MITMLEPSVEDLLNEEKNPEITSKFELITMVAKRARQLKNGAQKMIETEKQKPVSIALYEIAEQKIIPVKEPTTRRE